MFRDIPPSPPLPLRRPDKDKEYNDTFLRPPQSPIVEALKTDFDRPITNLIEKTNNVIEVIPKNEKQDLDKYVWSSRIRTAFKAFSRSRGWQC